MNIQDFKGHIPEGDMLAEIFTAQRELMEKYHPIEEANGGGIMVDEIPVEIDDRRGQGRLKELAWRVTEEIAEAMGCLKNRPWKSTPLATDREHFYEELADATHFFIELLITAGIGPVELHDLYFRKNQVNQFRQRSNY